MANTYEFHYRRRYNLPPNDPLFLDATFEECVIDWWAHRHAEDPELHKKATLQEHEAELEEMEARINAEMAERLSLRLGKRVAADSAALIEETDKAQRAMAPNPGEDTEEVFSWRGR